MAVETATQKIAAEDKKGKVTAETVDLTETKKKLGELVTAYDTHLSLLQGKITEYTQKVTGAAQKAVLDEFELYKKEKETFATFITPEIAKAIETLQTWNGILSLKAKGLNNSNKTFADATFPPVEGKTPKERQEQRDKQPELRKDYERALIVVAEFIGVKGVSDAIKVDGKFDPKQEKVITEAIQQKLIDLKILSDSDKVNNKNTTILKPDGIPDQKDGYAGATTTAGLIAAVDKVALVKAGELQKKLEDRFTALDQKIDAAIKPVPAPDTGKTPAVVAAVSAVTTEGINVDTTNLQGKQDTLLATANKYRDDYITQLVKDLTDRKNRNVAMLAHYQMRNIDFKAVLDGTVPEKQLKKVQKQLIDVLSGIEGRHSDYDQVVAGTGEKSYHSNVKAAKKALEAEFKTATGDNLKLLLKKASDRLEELLTIKSDDRVYKDGKTVHKFGPEPELVYDRKGAYLLADKLKFDFLFEAFGFGKDESKKAPATVQ